MSYIQLLPIISNHAILQRNRSIPVCGEGEGRFTAVLEGTQGTETHDFEAHGAFEVLFSPHEAGGPWKLTISEITSGKERMSAGGFEQKADREEDQEVDQEVNQAENSCSVILEDLWFGDVILLSGQSNMELKLNQLTDPVHVASPNPYGSQDPLLRFFHTRQIQAPSDLDDRWTLLESSNISEWPAIGYYVGQMLRIKHNVPIGLVGVYQGAGVIQSFLKKETAVKYTLPQGRRHPDHDHELYGTWNHPGQIYDFGMTKIIPMPVAAVLWYQGESNTSPEEGDLYGEMLESLIGQWREDFRDPKLPIVLIQINDFETPFSLDGWKKIQKAQEDAAGRIHDTTLVKIKDLGQHDLIHPINKLEVAQRVFTALNSF